MATIGDESQKIQARSAEAAASDGKSAAQGGWRRSKATWLSVGVLGVLFAAVAFGMPAIASHANPGTIKVHDEMTATPPQRNEPHVDCEDFWIEGFNLSHGSGEIVFYAWQPTGDQSEVLRVNWTAVAQEEEGDGFHLLEGPFTLPAGHYKVLVFMDAGHPGNEDHFAKSKMFWVDACEPNVNITCPTDLLVASQTSGGFQITWTPASGSDGSIIYRAVGTGDFEFYDFVEGDADSYVDTNVQPGVTYTYTVTALFGEEESVNCAEASISMIPDFPTVAAMATATLAAVAGYAVMSRRRN